MEWWPVDGGRKVACGETKADGLTIIGNETIPVALRAYTAKQQSSKKRMMAGGMNEFKGNVAEKKPNLPPLYTL